MSESKLVIFWEGQIMDENKIIDQLFSKEYTPQDDSEQAKNGDVSLYGLLDEVANGRRLMNCLFHSPMQMGNKLSTDKLDGKCRQIQRDWIDEEKTITMNSGALQLDGPVLFSWSHNVAPTSHQETINTTFKQGSPSRGSNKSKITTTSQLFDRASAEIDKCIKPNSKSWMVEERFERNEAHTADGKKPSTWANSDFKVDPLQKFVVKELPKEKKKSDGDKTKKNKSKRKSFFGFWGHSGSKSGSKKKSEKPIEAKNEIQDEVSQKSGLSPDDDTTFSDKNTIQSKQESMSDQQAEPKVHEPAVTNTGCSEHDDGDGFEQVPAQSSYHPSSEPSIASTPSLTLDSFIPLQPKKKI